MTRARSASLPLALGLALAALGASPAADLQMTRSGGLIGEPLTWDLSGDPGEIWIWIPSLNNGPIPLSIFDGVDPRVLEVGFDLLFLQQIGFLDGSGAAQFTLFIPGDPTLIGAPLHAQALTWPGTTTTFDDLSNLTSTRIADHGYTHYAFDDNAEPRQGHTVTVLDDETVLVAGGDRTDTAGNLTPLDTVELYDPQSMRFGTATSTLTSERSTHTATKLQDGTVLLLGGYDASLVVGDTGEIWDPTTGTTTPIAPMGTNRTQHTATLLADGRVFVAGGSDLFDLAQPIQSILGAHDSTQIWDPGTGWSAGPTLPKPRVGHTATLLDDGRVLIAGGVEVTVVIPGIIEIPEIVGSCLLFDPADTSQLFPAGGMATPRVFHGSEKLDDGTVATVGGATGSLVPISITILGSVERYTPGTSSWSAAASLNSPRAYPNLVLAAGVLHVLGGLATVDIDTGSGTPEKDVESAPQTLAAWTSVGTMAEFREVGRAVAVEGGDRILSVGAAKDDPVSPTVILSNAELFVP